MYCETDTFKFEPHPIENNTTLVYFKKEGWNQRLAAEITPKGNICFRGLLPEFNSSQLDEISNFVKDTRRQRILNSQLEQVRTGIEKLVEESSSEKDNRVLVLLHQLISELK